MKIIFPPEQVETAKRLICRQNKQKRLTYGTLTQIPFTLYDNKKNLIFETIHFRLYAVAEAGAVDDTLADNQEPGNSSPVLWIFSVCRWCCCDGLSRNRLVILQVQEETE